MMKPLARLVRCGQTVDRECQWWCVKKAGRGVQNLTNWLSRRTPIAVYMPDPHERSEREEQGG